MEITTSHQSGVTVLSLNGRLDGLTSPVLEKAVDERLAANEAKIVFDCASLSYASSAGLRVLLSAGKKASAAGGRIAFTALQAPVVEVFQLSGFDKLFPIQESVASAVASFS
jgi:anti-sigma B factor antagonist